MKLNRGDLVLTRGIHNHNRNEFSISVVLDEDCGCSNCHIRDIYRLDKSMLHITMNWSNIKRDSVISVLGHLGDMDYTKDNIDIRDRIPYIKGQLIELIPEYIL